MRTTRGALYYVVFATAIFAVLQVVSTDGTTAEIAISAAFFFLFTFGMMLLVNRVLDIVGDGFGRKKKVARETEVEPVESRTTRPEHARRRREKRRRKR